MGVIRKPEVGKHYMLGCSIILVTHVDKKTYTYSYVNHHLFTSKDSFTWNIKTFNEIELTGLLGGITMKLEVGELYIRNDFLYSAIILGIINDNVTYEFCNIKDGYKSKWSVDSTQFRKNYFPTTSLLKALF